MSWLCFFESHIEELPDLCVEKLAEAVDKRVPIVFDSGIKGEKAMDGFVKTLGVLMALAAVALWAALIFFVPAALIKFLWLYLVA